MPGTLASQLEILRQRVRAAHGSPGASLEVVQDLETAYEELVVAEEEVRAQQEQIGRLLDDHRLLRWQHERMLSLLPVPCSLKAHLSTLRQSTRFTTSPLHSLVRLPILGIIL